MPHGIMFCDYIWSICRGKSQISCKCCKKWEDICLVASVYWIYINTSQAQMKKRKWKDFVFFRAPIHNVLVLCYPRNDFELGVKMFDCLIKRDKSWNTVMNIWVWTFNFFFKHKDKKKKSLKKSHLSQGKKGNYISF